MSRVPRSVEDGQFDDQTGNADDQNKSMDMTTILDQLERLSAPVEEPKLDEPMPERWKEENNRRILARIKATVSDMAHFLENPQTVRLLSQQGTSEQRQRDYAATREKAEILKMGIEMSKTDCQELNDTYVPGVDSPALGKVIVTVTNQIQALEEFCNRFL